MTLICQTFRNNKPLPKYLTDQKLKMSVVFIFEIKDTKKNKIFNFLKGSFSVIRDPMAMIFGAFSETFMKFLESITSQFFLRYSKSYNNLNVKSYLKLKTQQPLTKRRTALELLNYMHLIQLYKFSLERS